MVPAFFPAPVTITADGILTPTATTAATAAAVGIHLPSVSSLAEAGMLVVSEL